MMEYCDVKFVQILIMTYLPMNLEETIAEPLSFRLQKKQPGRELTSAQNHLLFFFFSMPCQISLAYLQNDATVSQGQDMNPKFKIKKKKQKILKFIKAIQIKGNVYSLADFSATHSRETTFVISCLLSFTSSHIEMLLFWHGPLMTRQAKTFLTG